MTDEKLLFALEQKTLLLTKIADLTKQIEVKSKQKEIRLENLPTQRQILLNRVEKCNRMIDGCVKSLPEDSRERMRQILAGKIRPEECTPEETVLLRHSLKCLSLLRTILAENNIAVVRVRKERNRLQKAMSKLRKDSNASGSMFHVR